MNLYLDTYFSFSSLCSGHAPEPLEYSKNYTYPPPRSLPEPDTQTGNTGLAGAQRPCVPVKRHRGEPGHTRHGTHGQPNLTTLCSGM